MDNSRRRLLKGAAVAGGGAAALAGYSGPLAKMGKGLVDGTSGEKPDHPIYGNALKPEYTVDPKTGELTLNPEQRIAFTVCYGCTTQCGVRVRIDNNSDEVLRSIGNPYHPLSAEPNLPMDTPVVEALKSVSGYQEQGLDQRSTTCARGNAMIAQITSPHRVTHCLKRVGERGSHRWERISFEQLIDEVCEGGDLFGEGHVAGLSEINDHDTPLDEDNPEYGPRANQLLVMEATDYGRSALLKRFTFNAFGTRNYGHHGSYCGLAFRMGSGAVMNDLEDFSHTKPDYAQARFALFIGTAPSQAGNPFKRQGRMLAEARTHGNLKYVVVDPALNATASYSAAERSRWVPIRPGTDTAFAMAVIQWLLENRGYAEEYLVIPNQESAEQAGETGHTNATHLVIEDDEHPRYGHFLMASDIDGDLDEDADQPMVIDSEGELVAADDTDRAELFVDQQVQTEQGRVRVKSSLAKLREAANEYSRAEYADYCDVPVGCLENIAEQFAAYGRRAVADSHGGMMSSNGFYAVYGVQMLNLLAGNINHKGGAAHAPGQFNGTSDGPRYNLDTFDGMRKPEGVFVSRSKFAYEDTSEYRRKKEAGENPYPARAPWRALAPPILTEQLASALDGYPYRIKALIGCMANPFYGQAGLRSTIEKRFKDPDNIGLYVAIDGFINETNQYADYIVPDSVMYEVWGFTGAWSGVLGKTTTACWPVVEPRQQKTGDGQPVSLESFFIAAAKKLDLPGFGEDAIPSADGKSHYPLHTAEDFFLRAAANIAFQDEPLPTPDESDMRHAGIEPLLPRLQETLPADERGPVAYLYSRGGRFQDPDTIYANDTQLADPWTKPLCVYNEQLGTTIDSQTGQYHVGTPCLRRPVMADGSHMRDVFSRDKWPLLAFSFKSNIMNSYAIGLERLRMIKPYNPVLLHTRDAEARGIEHGDTVRITSPGGERVALALVSDGVAEGALGIEHSYGHTELGGSSHHVDGEEVPGMEWVQAGININDLGFADPTREVTGTWLDTVTGASVRQGLPVEVKRA